MNKAALGNAMTGHVLAKTEPIGGYKKGMGARLQ